MQVCFELREGLLRHFERGVGNMGPALDSESFADEDGNHAARLGPRIQTLQTGKRASDELRKQHYFAKILPPKSTTLKDSSRARSKERSIRRSSTSLKGTPV